jgi:AcrR family transcriptional regulator
VTLDEIAAAVDVAKGTLYSHFPTKTALLAAIVRPALVALEQALRAIKAKDAEAVVAGLLREWARLVRERHDAMHVAHGFDAELPDSVMAIHGRVVKSVLRLLAQRAVAARLRGSPEWAAMLIARLGLPLFDSFEGLDPTGEAFVEAVSLLLLRRVDDTRKNVVAPRAARGKKGLDVERHFSRVPFVIKSRSSAHRIR